MPFGICAEPSNVQAGGSACPIGSGALGADTSGPIPPTCRICGTTSTVAADRERVRAATEIDDWARTEAIPCDAEITQMRQLIRRVEHDLDALDENDRRQIEEAVADRPRHPPDRAPRPTHHTVASTRSEPGRPTVTTQPTNPLLAARRNDSDRRRRRVLDALDRLRTDGHEITVSAVARTAGFSELRMALRP